MKSANTPTNVRFPFLNAAARSIGVSGPTLWRTLTGKCRSKTPDLEKRYYDYVAGRLGVHPALLLAVGVAIQPPSYKELKRMEKELGNRAERRGNELVLTTPVAISFRDAAPGAQSRTTNKAAARSSGASSSNKATRS